MPSSKFDWLNRVKAVEREHAAARFAVEFLLDSTQRDVTLLVADLRIRDLKNAAERLEGTYIVRLFAEFEASLRTYWTSVRGADPPVRTRDLIDGVAARRKIPFDAIQHAHTVREVRNYLVHEREKEIDFLAIATARSHLCIFLSFLPREW
jgi:uncharacterized protein (DUF2164 family)